jgi:hypothetical protein
MSNTEGKQNITQNSNTIKFDAVKTEKASIRAVENSHFYKPKSEKVFGKNENGEYTAVRQYTGEKLEVVEQKLLGSVVYTPLYLADSGVNLLQRRKLSSAFRKLQAVLMK